MTGGSRAGTGGAAGPATERGVPLFTQQLFRQAVEARDSYVQEHPDCRLALRLVNGDDIYVDEIRATGEEGVVCSCVERGKASGSFPLAVIPWAAVLRVDVIDRLPWAATPGFRPA